MSLQSLVGRHVRAVISEPWEFGVEHGRKPLAMRVETAYDGGLALRFIEPVTFEGVVLDRLVATPRHSGESLEEITRSTGVFVNLTPAPMGAAGDRPDDAWESADRWRRWHLIGTL